MVKVVVLMNGQVLFCTAPSLSGSSLVTPVVKNFDLTGSTSGSSYAFNSDGLSVLRCH